MCMIEVNLPQLGNIDCDRCGAPCGIHKGNCPTIWREQYDHAGDELAKARVKKQYIKRCHELWLITPVNWWEDSCAS